MPLRIWMGWKKRPRQMRAGSPSLLLLSSARLSSPPRLPGHGRAVCAFPRGFIHGERAARGRAARPCGCAAAHIDDLQMLTRLHSLSVCPRFSGGGGGVKRA